VGAAEHPDVAPEQYSRRQEGEENDREPPRRSLRELLVQVEEDEECEHRRLRQRPVVGSPRHADEGPGRQRQEEHRGARGRDRHPALSCQARPARYGKRDQEECGAHRRQEDVPRGLLRELSSDRAARSDGDVFHSRLLLFRIHSRENVKQTYHNVNNDCLHESYLPFQLTYAFFTPTLATSLSRRERIRLRRPNLLMTAEPLRLEDVVEKALAARPARRLLSGLGAKISIASELPSRTAAHETLATAVPP